MLISHDLSGGAMEPGQAMKACALENGADGGAWDAKEPRVLNLLDELEPGTDREPALRYAMRRLLVPLVVLLHKQQRGWPPNVLTTYVGTTASRGVI